jgi:hypothetical protein
VLDFFPLVESRLLDLSLITITAGLRRNPGVQAPGLLPLIVVNRCHSLRWFGSALTRESHIWDPCARRQCTMVLLCTDRIIPPRSTPFASGLAHLVGPSVSRADHQAQASANPGVLPRMYFQFG